MMRPTPGVFLCMFIAGTVSSCSLAAPQPAWVAAVAGDGPGELQKIHGVEPVVQNLPKSRRGNPDEYSVFGQSYKVMDSAHDFAEQGIASWYGRKFHGRATSSGEPYDMHQLTAAHKTLPLPTFVRVTRVDNGQSLVVKVNDRGPFVGDRIIDLSYAAAATLGMLEHGKAEVQIEALSTHGPLKTATSAERARPVAQVVPAEVQAHHYLQVGAFAESLNAQAMLDNLHGMLSIPAQIDHDVAAELYRVRIGPLSDSRMLQSAQDSLAHAGIDSVTVTSTNP
ncbi:MAG: septal ring lytic transglycosylase RlpA family protein [Granulosicoccus sp.]|nr:septal ring lytic transglycosylase RlpA family protein [Granulosicoccus sp.]